MCSHLVAVQTPQNNRKDDYNFGWFAEVSATKWTPTTQLAWGCRRTPKKGQPTNKSTHHQSLPHQQATQPTNSEWLRDLTYRTSSKRKWPLRHRAKTLAQLAPLAVAFHYDRLRMLRGNGSTVCHDKPVCDIQYSVVCPVQVSAKHLKKKNLVKRPFRYYRCAMMCPLLPLYPARWEEGLSIGSAMKTPSVHSASTSMRKRTHTHKGHVPFKSMPCSVATCVTWFHHWPICISSWNSRMVPER